MALMIPALHQKRISSRMTTGERGFATRLMTKLEDDYTCWYDVPIGTKQLRPDFIVLHPGRGILVLEVKDWKPETTLIGMNRLTAEIRTEYGDKTVANPLEQARNNALEICNLLERDLSLVQQEGHYKGKLLLPWGYGVVLSNFTRKQFDDAGLADAIDPHRVICKDEMVEAVDDEAFQRRLWDMFTYRFGTVLSLANIDRIRWHLFPEIRCNNGKLFEDKPDPKQSISKVIPDIIKVMDMQQEQLARNLGEGHRVVHGVAGSGKTLILAYRCMHLQEMGHNKPVLVLCFNEMLAARLRALLQERGVGDGVHVYHFHNWCDEQRRLYHVDLPEHHESEHHSIRVAAVMDAVESGHIPRAQYAAILIDEGHDFEPEWFQLVVQMIDPETNSLLLLYDDAQSIYGKEKKRDFSWASVGVKASGRTTILKVNYRNTVELLTFAQGFVKHYLDAQAAHGEIPLIKPELAGRNGIPPEVKKFSTVELEVAHIASWLKSRHEQGIPYKEMALLYRVGWQADKLEKLLMQYNLPLMRQKTRGFNLYEESVKLLTLHSSKGLEFDSVVIPDLGSIPHPKEDLAHEAKLLYIGMTRATSRLLVTSHSESEFTKRLEQVSVASTN